MNSHGDNLSNVNSSSKSLYQKVLAESGSRSFLPKNRYTSSFAKYTKRNGTDNSEPTVKTNTENKYSSVIRNSRPKPQNDGLEKNSEYDALFRERPQYVTINRSAPSLSTRLQNDEDSSESDEEQKDVSLNNDDDTDFILATLTSTTTAQPHHQYVNIQRNRGTTPKTEEQTTSVSNNDFDEDADIESDEMILDELEGLVTETTSKKPFSFLNRGRPTTTTTTQTSIIADVTEPIKTTNR